MPDFADTYAQTITYGLLTAAISRTDMSGGADGTALVAENITEMVPVTNPFLKEMLGTFLHAGGRPSTGSGTAKVGIDFDELGIQDVVELLRSDETDLPAILRDFNNRAEGEDPVIRFYEDFLSAYDKALKVQRGVFYTPKPVVSYIVRGVHELLISDFGLEDGLAATVTWGALRLRSGLTIPKGVDPNSFFVMILDPATGTATFLVEVIDVIYKTMVAKWKKQGYKEAQIQAAWNEYVPTSLLPRLYGYELMMAPYAIAHMKIGLKLFETGYRFASDQRANIYLTNALEEPSQLAQGSAASLFEALGHESQAVNDVKRGVHFTVVIGNPPYSGNSANASKNDDGSLNFIGKILQDYYKVDGKPLGEKNPKWLQDDYVKFLRFAQWNIHQPQTGILAMITNHGYLDNPTFRGMRQSLLTEFSDIYILNLHGNSRKKETALDGSEDNNVFDIQQGVCIWLSVKRTEQNSKPKPYYFDLYGLRENKYDFLLSNNLATTKWGDVTPEQPFYLFIPQNADLRSEYNKYFSSTELIPVSVLGFQTHRDDFAIDIDKSSLLGRITEMRQNKLTDKEFSEKYQLQDNRDWQLSKARKDLRRLDGWQKKLIEFLYRPFDVRYCYFDEVAMDYPRRELKDHVAEKPNLCLLLIRQMQDPLVYSHVLVSKSPSIDRVFACSRGAASVFPLYLYPTGVERQQDLFSIHTKTSDGKRPNLSEKIISTIQNDMGFEFIPTGSGNLRKTFGAEDVFHYMYAVFHSPTYRSRYAEFLKIDFPRLPLTSNVALFRQLCGLGKELVGLHLLEDKRLENRGLESSKVKFVKGQTSQVAKGYPKYEDGKVYVNEEHYFDGVREDVWNFHIGGYQVCAKWLKDRRERELSAEDIVHYGKVVSALGETIRIMKEVDGAIEVNGGWPVK